MSPAARKRARELDLDPSSLAGTSRDGAVTLECVQRAARSAQRPAPAVATADQAERKQALRHAIAAAMTRSKREIPHYYLATTINLGPALSWLTTYNAARSVTERLLPGVLRLKAVARAAREMPDFNAYFEDGAARVLEHVHVGVAISLRGGGLVAPAIHDADQLTLDALMTRLQDLVGRARAGSLRASELSDGTLTVTQLGERGVEAVFPIGARLRLSRSVSGSRHGAVRKAGTARENAARSSGLCLARAMLNAGSMRRSTPCSYGEHAAHEQGASR